MMKHFVIVFLLISCSTGKTEEKMPETVSESEFRSEVEQLESEKTSEENVNESSEIDLARSLVYSEEIRNEVRFSEAIDTITLDSAIIQVFEVKGVPFTRRERQDVETEQRDQLSKLIKKSGNKLIKDSLIFSYQEFILIQERNKIDTVFIKPNKEVEDVRLAEDVLLLDYLEVPELIFVLVQYKDFGSLRLIDINGESIEIDEKPVFNKNWDMFITIFDTFGLTEPYLNIYKKEGNGFNKFISVRLSELPSKYGRLVGPLWVNERSFLIHSSSTITGENKYLGFRIIE